jgi:hypothetical protein
MNTRQLTHELLHVYEIHFRSPHQVCELNGLERYYIKLMRILLKLMLLDQYETNTQILETYTCHPG